MTESRKDEVRRIVTEGFAPHIGDAVTSERLLPCPFCGGEAEFGGYHGSWFVRCRKEGCWAGVHGSLWVDEADAIAAWNLRPLPYATDENVMRQTLGYIEKRAEEMFSAPRLPAHQARQAFAAIMNHAEGWNRRHPSTDGGAVKGREPAEERFKDLLGYYESAEELAAGMRMSATYFRDREPSTDVPQPRVMADFHDRVAVALERLSALSLQPVTADGWVTGKDISAEASASLIAAAPDLLEAVHWIVAAMGGRLPDYVPLATMEAAVAAIAKAEGRS